MTTTSEAARWARRLAPLVPLLATLAVWAPLRRQYFRGDDFVHLYDVVSRSFTSLLGQLWGGHLHAGQNAVFWTLFELFGPDPRGYFATVLVTHLLNTFLLYHVVRAFTSNTLLACFGALLWGACPILEGALGWFAVYGQVLLTTIVLAILWHLDRTLARGAPLATSVALLWAILLAVGSVCFGMGLGIIAAFPIAVALAAGPGRLPRRTALVLALVAMATLVGYLAVLAAARDIPPAEREALRPFSHPGWLPSVLALEAHLLGFGAAALLFDVLGEHQRLSGWAQAAGGAVLAALVLAASAIGNMPERRRLLALAILAAAAYGSVAVGRATFYATVHHPPAAAATAARYHYLPLALLTVLVCTALAQLASRGPTMDRAVSAAAGVWMMARLAIAAVCPFPVALATEERAETEAMLASIHAQVAVTPRGHLAIVENRAFGPTRALPDAMPGWAGMFIVFYSEDAVDGRPVRFLVSEDDWRRAQARGGRIAALVTRR